MRIYVDNEKTLGNTLVYVGAADWLDFNDSKKVLGTKITVVAVEADYEKVVVKIRKPMAEISGIDILKKNSKVSFDNLMGNVYLMNGKQGVSWMADDVEFSLI